MCGDSRYTGDLCTSQFAVNLRLLQKRSQYKTNKSAAKGSLAEESNGETAGAPVVGTGKGGGPAAGLRAGTRTGLCTNPIPHAVAASLRASSTQQQVHAEPTTLGVPSVCFPGSPSPHKGHVKNQNHVVTDHKLKKQARGCRKPSAG